MGQQHPRLLGLRPSVASPQVPHNSPWSRQTRPACRSCIAPCIAPGRPLDFEYFLFSLDTGVGTGHARLGRSNSHHKFRPHSTRLSANRHTHCCSQMPPSTPPKFALADATAPPARHCAALCMPPLPWPQLSRTSRSHALGRLRPYGTLASRGAALVAASPHDPRCLWCLAIPCTAA